MVLRTLSVQKTGMITLPKAWRERHPSTFVIAQETPEGLLIRPYSDIEYWEDSDGNYGIRMPGGIDAERLLGMLQHSRAEIEHQERRSRRLKRPKKHR